MELTQTRLSRLQLFGTLLIVSIVALCMSGYFVALHWHDFSSRQDIATAQAETDARARLRSYGEQTAQMLAALREQASATLKQRIRDQADQAYNTAQTIWQQEHPHRSKAEVAQIIVKTLRAMRNHNNQSYYFINALSGEAILQSGSMMAEGKNILSLKDDTGRKVIQGLITATDNPEGSGFSYYRWPLPGQNQMMDKISYARRFQPLNWLIGTGEYVPFADRHLQQEGLALLAQLQQNTHNHFMVIDNSGKMLMYPPAPALAGQHYLALEPSMRATVVAILAKGEKDGFIEYRQQGTPMLAYAHRLPGWDWLLVTSTPEQRLIDRNRLIASSLKHSLEQHITATILMTLGALAIACLFSWAFIRWMNALIVRSHDNPWISHRDLKERSRELELSCFMLDNATEILCLMDQHARLAYLNGKARTCLGEPGQQYDRYLAALFQAPQAQFPQTYTVTLPGDELRRTFEVTQCSIEYQGEQYRSVTARDISSHIHADRELRLAARVFESSSEAILIADSQNRIMKVNRAFLDNTGYEEHEVVGHTPSMLASGRHSRNFYDEMWKILRTHGQWSGEIWNRRKNGDIAPEWLNISILADGEDKISHYVALFTDISERRHQEAQNRYQAEIDFLTELPNRARINDRLQQEIRLATASSSELAVLFIDLDNFKNVNDTLGHLLGDELLKEVANRLSRTLREVDTLGRSGGDEFVLVMPRLPGHEEAEKAAERILKTLRRPFLLSGHSLKISASIGISLFPKDGHDIQGLLMSADLAMYHAKASGRNTFRFYSSQMNAQFNERLLLESRLREALDKQELVLMFQPQLSIDGQMLAGCEALLRWHHEELGFVAPARFIPVAEETGLIDRISALVLDQTCKQIADWQQKGITVLPVAVNVTATQLARHNLVDDIRASLAKYQLPGEVLALEMNEDALMANPAHALAVLDRIRACGVRLVIDDFGMGYSSPAHLKRFSPDAIKINHSFIEGLPDDSEHAAIVSSIIHLAGALNIPAVAEGVETEAQRRFLERMGCKEFQGFLAGAPQSAEGMCQLLAQRRAGATTTG
jgi:diguanylate cyclase (GGDEF)-like protein/PAS domain S-box-containing protein